jgi:hypothetical protein
MGMAAARTQRTVTAKTFCCRILIRHHFNHVDIDCSHFLSLEAGAPDQVDVVV